MRLRTASACLVALVLAVSGCTTDAPKDSSPVVAASSPAPSPTPSDDPSDEPTEEELRPLDPEVDPTGSTSSGAGSPSATEEQLFGSGVHDLLADVEAADLRSSDAICRGAGLLLSEMSRSQVEARQDAMSEEDLEALKDLLALCDKVLSS